MFSPLEADQLAITSKLEKKSAVADRVRSFSSKVIILMITTSMVHKMKIIMKIAKWLSGFSLIVPTKDLNQNHNSSLFLNGEITRDGEHFEIIFPIRSIF